MSDAAWARLGHQPLTLTGSWIRLESYEDRHYNALKRAADDPRIWEWMPKSYAGDNFGELIAAMKAGRGLGHQSSFTAHRISDNAVIGLTEYLNIRPADRSVEIGSWFIPDEWSGPANPDSKLLLLRYAFEELRCHRVQFRTDRLNERSRRAILKLGALEEGILRHEKSVQGLRLRDTCIFSILAGEWPVVRERLQDRLGTIKGEVVRRDRHLEQGSFQNRNVG